MPRARKVSVRRIRSKPRRELVPFVTKTINATSWKPQTSWLIVLRTTAGGRDFRSFTGTYEEGVFRRDDYISNSLYASAWLIEEREKSRYASKAKKSNRGYMTEREATQ